MQLMRLSLLTKAGELDWPFKSLEDNCCRNENSLWYGVCVNHS